MLVLAVLVVPAVLAVIAGTDPQSMPRRLSFCISIR